MSREERPEERLVRLARSALAGRVARTLAHEVNDLLVGIVGVEEQARAAADEAERDAVLDLCAECGRQIADLMRAFQEPFGGPEPEKSGRRADVQHVLDSALRLARKRAAWQGVAIRRTGGPGPEVRADVGALVQVCVELIDAALDIMPGGGRLGVAAEEEGGEVRVTIWAAGPEGSPARWDPGFGRLLAPGEDAPANAGSVHGLGLTAAREIVRGYGGRLALEAAPGSGVRFVLTLPAARGADPSGR
ncbi:MAG: ATP-binding protein [bacterium]